MRWCGCAALSGSMLVANALGIHLDGIILKATRAVSMMGDLDTCLDAFKHLPYFKPLYTTILRQQMQYLTEQLSRHAGEESLVLTTNLSAGTISSLTSTHGTGFLDLRSDIKKQFTVHCAKNQMKQERSYSRRNVSYDNAYVKDHTNSSLYIKDHTNSSLKRKRPDDQFKQHTVTDRYTQSSHVIDNNEKHIASEKNEENVSHSMTDTGVVNIEIENVRSLQPEDSASNLEVEKSSENLTEASNLPESNYINEAVFKQEVGDEESFIATENTREPNQAKVLDESQENVIVIRDADSECLQEYVEVERSSTSIEQRNTTGSMHEITDDVATIQNSYYDRAEPSSLPENIVTETDGGDMWILAGNNSETDIIEIPDSRNNESCLVDKHIYPQITDTSLNKSVESVTDESYENEVRIIATYANVQSLYEKGAQLSSQMPAHKLRFVAEEKRAKFDCRYCSQKFTTFASRKRHERKHTGETPWACEFCDRKFYRKDDLNVHSLKHNGQKPYMCPVCNTGYCKRKMLEAHVLSCHADTMTSNSIQYMFS